MEEDFIARLLADTGISALVGTRIQWDDRPQASGLPAIVLQIVDEGPANDQCGADALHETTVQIDCWATTKAKRREVKRAIKAAVSGQSFTHGTTVFTSLFITGGGDTAETAATGGSLLYRTRIDVQIWHREEN